MIASAILVGAIPLFVWIGKRFHARQNGGALGGAMSRAKAFWLPFAIYFWFVVCAVVAVDGVVAHPFRVVLGAFAAWMWIRGVAEMLMLYVWKNWKPPIGVGHDFTCVVLVGALLVVNARDIIEAVTSTACSASLDRWTLALCATVLVSLVVEMHHAWSFHDAVRGKTTGDEGVWFADDEAEHFRAINRRTRRFNFILGFAVGAYVVRYVCERIFT